MLNSRKGKPNVVSTETRKAKNGTVVILFSYMYPVFQIIIFPTSMVLIEFNVSQ